MSRRRMLGLLARLGVWALGITCIGLLLAVGIGPRTGRYRTLTVLSGSMSPGIPVGAVVMIVPERPDQLRVGQIVTYQIPVDDHRVVTHRVVQIVEGGDHPVFKTQGDANNAPDSWLAQVSDPTVWRVRYVVPHLGLVFQWLRRPVVHTATVIVLPLLVALAWIVGIWRGDRTTPAVNAA
jgi:signal peptidase